MPGPFDYAGTFGGEQSPLQAFNQGLQSGNAMQQMQLAEQQRQLQLQQAQAAQQRQQAMQSMAVQVAQNPTPQAIAQLSIAFPEISEQVKRSYDMLSPEQQQQRLQMGTSVYSAVLAKDNANASEQLRDYATAVDNSGDKQQAAVWRNYAKLIDTHPESANLIFGNALAGIMGPEKFAAAFGAIGKEQREQQLAPVELQLKQAEAAKTGAEASILPVKSQADIENIRSQIAERSGKLALDKDKLESEVKLKLTELGAKQGTIPDSAHKLINDAVVASTTAEQTAGRFNDLASQLEQQGSAGYGLGTSFAEWLAKITGNQDALTGLRQEYVRLRSSQVVKSLPPGPASDKDIQLALSGFPSETADTQYLARFLRGTAKLSQYDAAMENAKSEWASSVGHLGKTKSDIEVDGTKVPAGSTFTEFARKFVQRKADQIAKDARTAEIKGRSYMRFAQPEMTTPTTAAVTTPTVIGD